MSEVSESYLYENIPLWKEKLAKQNVQQQQVSPEEQMARDSLFGMEEVGLRHPSNDSVVKLRDDGSIDIFAEEKVGIRIDPTSKSVSVFADAFNIFSKDIHFRTHPNGLNWNGYYFNPELYQESETERAQMIQGTKEYYHDPAHKDGASAWHRDAWGIRPMIRSKTRYRYSDGFIENVQAMGLPVVPTYSWEKE